jgi:hypothetical protein
MALANKFPRHLIKNGLLKGMAIHLVGREEGIRTLDTLRYTRFPGEPLQPLGHLSVWGGKSKAK